MIVLTLHTSPVQSDSESDSDSVTSFNVTCEAKVYPGWNILDVSVLNGHRVPFLRVCLSISLSLSLSIFRTNSFPISVSASFFLYIISSQDCGSSKSVAQIRAGYHAETRADRRALRNA